ncbi:hypothetical protein Q3G72_027854 [Acer saccharum]|nr:hypothetical protein Q3G72_027854 [Acer saccharum]
MVKLTIVGRVRDGLALAEGPRYSNQENENFSSFYKQQAEFILKEISIGALSPPKMIIRADHHSFQKLYIDTRTQANLSKLNARRRQDLDIVIEDMSQIVERRRNSEIYERMLMSSPEPVSSIWGSRRLEVIALKWTPVTIFVFVAAVLIWASLVLSDTLVI